MEPNKKYQVFEIICDEEKTLLKAIELYNKSFKTDFKLLEYILDEVNFAKIEGNIRLSDIFSLGTLYGRITSSAEL